VYFHDEQPPTALGAAALHSLMERRFVKKKTKARSDNTAAYSSID
jgi:hypothetical protein